MGKIKDIRKIQDLKPNKSYDIYGLLHHRERTANADLKRLANDNNGNVTLVKIPCNGQPEKHLRNSPVKGQSTANKHKSKSWEDNIDVDMLIADKFIKSPKFHKV